MTATAGTTMSETTPGEDTLAGARPTGADAGDEAAFDPSGRPRVMRDLYRVFHEREMTLAEVTWHQHRLHEWRRWSAVDAIDAIDIAGLSDADRVYVWNAGRAELTTKPGADRLAGLSDKECRIWQEKDPALAAVMQACGTWSRYWNEEEAYHETSFNRLAALVDMPRVDDETFIEFRKIFPDDDMLRTLTLLAISEIVAATNYAGCARAARDPGVKALFQQVSADEIQHMQYCTSVARALIDSGHYPAKDALAVAHLFVREGGELYGSRREVVEERGTHVNWRDTLEDGDVDRPQTIAKQQAMIFTLVRQLTDIEVNSAEDVEDAWMEMVGC